jgi:hypothetical protein
MLTLRIGAKPGHAILGDGVCIRHTGSLASVVIGSLEA